MCLQMCSSVNPAYPSWRPDLSYVDGMLRSENSVMQVDVVISRQRAIKGRPMRSSQSHPLMIAETRANSELGRIGITFCPGKRSASLYGDDWERDLIVDLEAIREWGAWALVTLIEEHEFDLLGVQELGKEAARLGMQWFHLPIVDVSIPNQEWETRWVTKAGNELKAGLKAGRDIVVHCRGGLGRAGMIAARLLIELGMAPADALAEVRRVRPGAVETYEQEKYVLRQRIT